MLEQKLREYVQKACPNIPDELRETFAQEMGRAVRAWASSPVPKRKEVLKEFNGQLGEKLLGPRSVDLELNFSKRHSPDEAAVQNAAGKFFTCFLEVVTTYRAEQGIPVGQLSFKIDGIDMDHPKLAVVQCTITDPSLSKTELRHGQGRTNRRKAGRPGLIRFDFDALEGLQFGG